MRRVTAIIVAAFVFTCAAGAAVWYLRQPPANPSLPVPDASNPPLQSQGDKYIFSCPRPANNEKRSREEILAEIRANAFSVGETFGLEIALAELPNGVRLDFVPKTPERQLLMNGIEKMTYEARAVTNGLLVSLSIEAIEPLNLIFSLMPIDPKDKTTPQMKQLVEKMTGVPEGACQLL